MASAYEPIAEISENNQGSINTLTTVILVVVSLIFSCIRYIIARQKLLSLELDDVFFGVALVSNSIHLLSDKRSQIHKKQILSLITSIASQRMVPLGLGQPQDAVSAENLSQFYKVVLSHEILL